MQEKEFPNILGSKSKSQFLVLNIFRTNFTWNIFGNYSKYITIFFVSNIFENKFE